MTYTHCIKILRINLTTRTITVEKPEQSLIQQYIGGRGLGTKLYTDEGCSLVDALGPENKIFFITAPLTRLGLPSAGRYAIITKSPVTGLLTCSNASGLWGTRLIQAGWDGLIIEGQSSDWIYIHINGSNIELLDASEYLGLFTEEQEQKIKETYGSHSSTLSIGIAGEHQILQSSVMLSKEHAVGRSGMGAVMGSKKLKAIVISPSSREACKTVSSLYELKQNHPYMIGLCRKCPRAVKRNEAQIDEVGHLCNQYGLDVISVSASIFKENSQKSRHNEKKAFLSKTSPELSAIIDSLGLCLFTSTVLGINEYTNLLNASMGTEYTPQEVLEIGRRILDTQ